MKYKTLQDIKDAKEVISCPGDTLLETINFKGMSQSELAMRMGRPVKTINEIIQGKAAITPETALQLERVLGASASFWLERERLYRLDLAEIQESELLLESQKWATQFPLKEMMKLQWLTFENDIISKVNALLRFFSVANKESFSKYYSNNLYPALFRISAKDTKNAYAIVSWLRRGDIQAEEVKAPAYDVKKFKNSLPEIKQLMAKNHDDFFPTLQAICLASGVKVVYTPCLPKAPIHGATRWMNENPLIQLTGRYKRNDIFWFSFFHEAGHIFLHGKKDVFIEGMEPAKDQKVKEEEANEFAIKWTLTEEEEQQIIDSRPITIEQVSVFAKKFGTHEALIIGRLAKHGYIYDSAGWDHGFFHKVMLDSAVNC